jgi:cytochrome b
MGAWDNGQLIKSNMAQKGVTVTDEQARSAAHEISDKAWAVHTYFGYTLGALLLFRLAAEFFQLADQVLMCRIKNAYQQYYIIKKNREASRHEFWVKSLYAVFYVLLMITVTTGFCLAFEDDVPALKHMHFIREIHQVNMYLILAFIVIHLAGVFLAERKNGKGIVSDMINGGSE